MVSSHKNHQNGFTFQVRTIVPPDIHQIQPRATQVWNYDGTGFDTNCKWYKVVCTYKLFQGEIIWKVKTGERTPFWCTLIVFTRADGKCFIHTIDFHQAKKYSQDIHHNIPLEWTVHHTPSGYMYIDGWLMDMNQLSNICGAYPIKNQTIFFDGKDSHFEYRYITQMQRKTSRPSKLKQVTQSTTR